MKLLEKGDEMRITIVGKRGAQRVVQWSRAVGLALILAVMIGSVSAAVYRLLAGIWDVRPTLLGALGGVVVVGVGTVAGLRTPLDKLRTVA